MRMLHPAPATCLALEQCADALSAVGVPYVRFKRSLLIDHEHVQSSVDSLWNSMCPAPLWHFPYDDSQRPRCFTLPLCAARSCTSHSKRTS